MYDVRALNELVAKESAFVEKIMNDVQAWSPRLADDVSVVALRYLGVNPAVAASVPVAMVEPDA